MDEFVSGERGRTECDAFGGHAVLTSQVAGDLGLSVQNASTRLKNLVSQGYLMRMEDVADSGGIEFKYCAIKKSD